ncbi:MAG: VOC family protein [Patescibacteria group bacterium]
MNPVVHFEMPYEDKNRMADFYSKAFGWKSQILGPEMGEYIVAQTTEMDGNNMVTKPGTINGGFFKRSKPDQGVSVVISVEDIHAAMISIEESGGKVIGGQNPGEPDDIPGIGLYISFRDTEGNLVGVLQPKGM